MLLLATWSSPTASKAASASRMRCWGAESPLLGAAGRARWAAGALDVRQTPAPCATATRAPPGAGPVPVHCAPEPGRPPDDRRPRPARRPCPSRWPPAASGVAASPRRWRPPRHVRRRSPFAAPRAARAARARARRCGRGLLQVVQVGRGPGRQIAELAQQRADRLGRGGTGGATRPGCGCVVCTGPVRTSTGSRASAGPRAKNWPGSSRLSCSRCALSKPSASPARRTSGSKLVGPISTFSSSASALLVTLAMRWVASTTL